MGAVMNERLHSTSEANGTYSCIQPRSAFSLEMGAWADDRLGTGKESLLGR